MKTNVTFSEIVNQLYKVFSNEAEASQYTNTQSGAQYMGLCGWAGTMSPLNRAAFLQEFGQDVTDRAEREARARVAEYRAAYEASEYHRHELEAGEADPDQVPAVGSFVFGWTDWLKCEGGPMDPLKNHVNDWGSLRPELVEIAAVVEVEPAEFLSAETAHRIAREHQNHGGSRYNEADPLRLDGDPYAWTVGVLVVCRAYGDGEKSQTPARWYVVDSEGYDWARYILMPQRFASMYAEEIADLRAQRAAVEAQKAAEEEAAKAARLADYRARCARWEGAGLVDVRPLIAAESAAYGTREKSQIRSASAKLLAARRKNIATFIAAAFPGVKFSIRANNGWGAAYRISWTDGPTVETFRASTDVDLLFTTGEYYSNQDDSYDYDRKEFIDFAEKFMGFTRGGFDCDRHESQEFRDEIAARIREAVPGLPESDQAQIPEADALEVAEAADIISGDRAHRSRVVDMAERWGLLDVVAYVARITDRPTTSEASTDPTPDNGGTGAAYGDSEKSQISVNPGEIYKVEGTDRVIVVLEVEDDTIRETDIFRGKWSNQITTAYRKNFVECLDSGKIVKVDVSALPAEIKSVREWSRELSDHVVEALEGGARHIKEAYESMTKEEKQEAATRLDIRTPSTPLDMINLAVAHRWNRMNGRYKNCAAIEWVLEAEHEDEAFRMAAGAYALIFSEYVRKIAA